jgi:hypothetical protein
LTPLEPAPMPGAREARYLILLGVCSASFIIAIYVLHLFPGIAAPSAFALPPVLAIGLYLAIRLARSGTTAAPARWLIPGFIFIVGGAAFDMTATVRHSPDLGQETNPIARALLDSGYPLAVVYGLAIVCQGLWISLICTLWTALLKHRSTLVMSLREARSLLVFLKAATGGAALTWRQWLLPMRLSDLPDWSYAMWLVAVVLIAGGVDRWYLGLEWYGLVAGSRLLVVLSSIVGGLCIYLAWLWWASRATDAGHGIDAADPADLGR